MKNIFIASLIISLFLVLFLFSASGKNASTLMLVCIGLFLSFVAFISYHVVVLLCEDYKALHEVTK